MNNSMYCVYKDFTDNGKYKSGLIKQVNSKNSLLGKELLQIVIREETLCGAIIDATRLNLEATEAMLLELSNVIKQK